MGCWEKLTKWANTAAAVLVIPSLVVAICAFFAIGPNAVFDWLGRNSSNIASWVQAFGAIWAIRAGFRVAKFQLEAQRRDQAEQIRIQQIRKYRLFETRFSMLDALLTRVMHDVAGERPGWRTALTFITQQTKYLDALTPQDMPSSAAPTVLANLNVPLRALESGLQRAAERAEQRDQDRQAVMQLAQTARALVLNALDWASVGLNEICTDQEIAAHNAELALTGRGFHPTERPEGQPESAQPVQGQAEEAAQGRDSAPMQGQA